ncbi:MAG: hypothetical protein AAGI30_12800 [Planctomycetota bacterium]
MNPNDPQRALAAIILTVPIATAPAAHHAQQLDPNIARATSTTNVATSAAINQPPGATVDTPATPESSVSFAYDFSNSTRGWDGRFADLPVEFDPEQYRLDWGLSPAPIGASSALRIAARNRSDDISMMFTRRIEGLIPHARYAVSGTIDYLYNFTTASSGIGGSPGASVYLRYGAIPDEPAFTVDEIDHIRWANVDMGDQADPGGNNGINIGAVGTPPGSGEGVWLPQQRAHENNPASPSFTAFAAPDGAAWIIFGTESGYEGDNEIYYTSATFRFDLAPHPARWATPLDRLDAFDLAAHTAAISRDDPAADIAAPQDTINANDLRVTLLAVEPSPTPSP